METSPLWQESELCLAPMAFKQGRIFIVPHLAVALGLGLSGLVHRTAPPFSRIAKEEGMMAF